MSETAKGRFNIFNSNLSEYGPMSYEYGYGLENPKNLCIWEAQFGDFYNPAQILIDQYLMGPEEKWMRQSGLVIMLPHGFDGAGPEHSSAHIERFLQKVNSSVYNEADYGTKDLTHQNTNMHMANLTTPSNYYHILRRHMLRNYRKPLILFTPKQGIRHPLAKSDLTEFDEGTKLQPVIVEKFTKNDKKIKKVFFCSGAVWLKLHQVPNAELEHENFALIRIEELSPFPMTEVRQALMDCNFDKNDDTEVYYIQEENINFASFEWSKMHIKRVMGRLGVDRPIVRYIGRGPETSIATASSKDFKASDSKFMNQFKSAIGLKV